MHARHEDEGNLQPLERLGDVESHQVGQKHVDDDEIWPLLAHQFQRRAAARRSLHLVARLLESRGEKGEKLRVVVENQDPRGRHPASLRWGTLGGKQLAPL